MYRWAEHTGELELEIHASSEPAVFEEAFAAMRELLSGETRGPLEPQHVALAGGDRAVLLADWLAELAYLAERHGLLPERLASLKLAAGVLEAVVEGSRGDPSHLVKAATYHRLSFERFAEGWKATVILDV